MNKTAIYPGTFDPITNGHVDVIERACEMFDHVHVVIAVNAKKQTLFSEEERFAMIKESLKHLDNVSVIAHHQLTVEIARETGAVAIVRGIRAVSDFEYEFQIALMNRKLEPNIYTVFLTPHEKYTYLNSSIVREMASYGKFAEDFVPPIVVEALKKKFESKS